MVLPWGVQLHHEAGLVSRQVAADVGRQEGAGGQAEGGVSRCKFDVFNRILDVDFKGNTVIVILLRERMLAFQIFFL